MGTHKKLYLPENKRNKYKREEKLYRAFSRKRTGKSNDHKKCEWRIYKALRFDQEAKRNIQTIWHRRKRCESNCTRVQQKDEAYKKEG